MSNHVNRSWAGGLGAYSLRPWAFFPVDLPNTPVFSPIIGLPEVLRRPEDEEQRRLLRSDWLLQFH